MQDHGFSWQNVAYLGLSAPFQPYPMKICLHNALCATVNKRENTGQSQRIVDQPAPPAARKALHARSSVDCQQLPHRIFGCLSGPQRFLYILISALQTLPPPSQIEHPDEPTAPINENTTLPRHDALRFIASFCDFLPYPTTTRVSKFTVAAMDVADYEERYFILENRLASFQGPQPVAKRRASNATGSRAPKALSWPHKSPAPIDVCSCPILHASLENLPSNMYSSLVPASTSTRSPATPTMSAASSARKTSTAGRRTTTRYRSTSSTRVLAAGPSAQPLSWSWAMLPTRTRACRTCSRRARRPLPGAGRTKARRAGSARPSSSRRPAGSIRQRSSQTTTLRVPTVRSHLTAGSRATSPCSCHPPAHFHPSDIH